MPRDDAQWQAEGRTDIPGRTSAAMFRHDAALDTRVVQLKKEKAGLIAYLLVKVEAGDWHAVQDAASDIREINAKLDVLG